MSESTTVQVESVLSSTLIHLDDLKCHPSKKLTNNFKKFKNTIMDIKIRRVLPTPKNGDLPFVQEVSEEMQKGIEYEPKLTDFGFSEEEILISVDSRQCYPFKGGEQNGLK